MSNKKKLSILIYSLAGGGAERVVSILLQELNDKFDITLVLMNDTIVYDIPNNIKIHFLEKSNPHESGISKLIKLPFLALKYLQFCKNNSIEISLSLMNRPVYVAMISKLFGNKIYHIISERSFPSELYKTLSFQSITNKLLIKSLYPLADVVITNSKANRADLIENFHIKDDNAITIYNPFDIDKIEKLSHESVNDFSFDKFTFITIGRLDSGKNHILLIEAMKNIQDANTQLLIIGKGPLEEYLKQKVISYNLENRVFFAGFKANPYKYLSRSHCFAFASNYEGFPNVLVEALACRLPIISTDCKSGPREILVDENEKLYGFLVPVNDTKAMQKKMELVSSDENLSNSYKNKAKIRAFEFDKASIVYKFMEILDGKRE